MPTSNTFRNGLLGTSGLAILAIVGVLSMHGIDPASIGLDYPWHHASFFAADSTADDALGACIFALSLVGLVALARSGRRPRVVSRPVSRFALSPRRPSDAMAGRHRLISLGVIRV